MEKSSQLGLISIPTLITVMATISILYFLNFLPKAVYALGNYEVYSANLTPVPGTGSQGSGRYTFKLFCKAETSSPYTGQYMISPSTSAPETFVTNLLGNPYNAHIHYTTGSSPMRGIIIPNDPPPVNIPVVSWLTQLIMPDKTTVAPALTQTERDIVRYQPPSGRPGTWVNIHTNACPSCQGGELQGDIFKISGDCDATLKGDFDSNGKIDIFDYNTLLTNFGHTGTGVLGDITGPNGTPDGVVSIYDYNLLLTNFGT